MSLTPSGSQFSPEDKNENADAKNEDRDMWPDVAESNGTRIKNFGRRRFNGANWTNGRRIVGRTPVDARPQRRVVQTGGRCRRIDGHDDNEQKMSPVFHQQRNVLKRQPPGVTFFPAGVAFADLQIAPGEPGDAANAREKQRPGAGLRGVTVETFGPRRCGGGGFDWNSDDGQVRVGVDHEDL